MYYKNADGDNIVDDNVISPFYDLTPNAAPNVEHLQIYAPDFEPADSWELLTKNFGGPVEGQPGVTEYVQTPTFALYNRHSGLVRVLTYIPTNTSSSFDIVRSSAGYDIGNSGPIFENGSAIFSFMKTPAPALDRFDPFGDIANSYNLYVDGGVWTILDFIAAYDPCVCFYPSAIKFLPTLRDTQSMTLHLEAQGITAPIIQNGQPASALQQGFKVAENGLGILGAGVKSFNTLNNYYSTVNDLVPATAPPGDLIPATGGSSLTVLKNLLPAWVDASCFENQYINFFSLFESDDITSFEQNLCGGAFTLHIFARLVPNDGSDEVVFMGEFEVEIAEAKTIDTPLPFTGFSNDLQAADGCQNGVLPPISYQELFRFCKNEYDPTPKKDNRSDDNPQPDNKPSLPEGRFYPNPFSTHLAYQPIDQAQSPLKVELFDTSGHLILSRSTDIGSQEHIFSLIQLAPGTYIAKVFYETTIETHKLIKL